MRISAVCVSQYRKARSREVRLCAVTRNGLIGDIHILTPGKHPVSVLPLEKALEGFRQLEEEVSFGRFGENLLIEGIDFGALRPGMRLKGSEVELEIAKLGAGGPASDSYSGFKVCSPMEPYFIFCDVVREGLIRKNESITLADAEEQGGAD